MKPEIKEMWIQALESGEYQQGRALHPDQDTFCCLGVLCDLYHKETGNGEWINEVPGDGIIHFKTINWGDPAYYSSMPPPEVHHWAYGETVRDDFFPHLSGLNDRSRYTFPQIAQVIREHAKEPTP